MFTAEDRIKDRLKSDYYLLASYGYNVVGVFLQGSQNYELDYEGSDIDTKAIILPKFTDFVLNKQPVSTTHILPSGEHLDIKDIRLMFDCFKKQNINFIEVLFTKYYLLNPEYANIYKTLLDNADLIAHYNNYAAINCIVGMIYEKSVALTHRYAGLADIIDKYGFDRKQLHHIVRCQEFLDRYIAGESYKDCLISKQPEYLIEIKRNPSLFSLDEAKSLAAEIVEKSKQIKATYMQTIPLKLNNKAIELLNTALIKILGMAFKKEIDIELAGLDVK